MRADRPDTVVLCGTFARHGDPQARLAAAGYEVVVDQAGATVALPGAADGMRFVVCDGDDFVPDRLRPIIAAAVGAGARVLVVSTSTDAERIISCFRSGATDYLIDSGPDGAGQIVRRLEAMRTGGGDGPGAALAIAVRRLVGKLHHDVKNPIGNILGYIDILREGMESSPSEEQSKLLLRIEQNCNRALDLLARFLDAANRLH